MWPIFLFFLYRGINCDDLYISADKGLFLVNGTDKTVVMTMNFSAPVYSMDYHFIKGYMYYVLDGSIFRINLDLKSEEEPVRIVTYRSGVFVTNLAVDWIHDKLYWIIGLQVNVYCADLDGNRPTLIISKDQVHDLNTDYDVTYLDNLLIDPYEQLLFMLASFESESYQTNTIIRSNLQGKDLATTFNTILRTASSLAIDLGEQRIYAAGIQTGQKHGFVCSVDYYGKDEVMNYKELMDLVHPIHVSAGIIYLVIHHMGVEGGPTFLYKMNLSSSNFNFESENINFTYIYKVKSFARENQLTPSEFAFTRCDSRVCSFQCIAFPTAGPTCVCPPGEKIAPLRRTCQVGEGVNVLISNLKNPLIYSDLVDILPLKAIRQRFAYHYQKDLIFIYSSSTNKICSSSLALGEGFVDIVDNIGWVCAIEVDWVNDNLYWIDGEGLKSSDLDGRVWYTRYMDQDTEINPSCDLQVDPYEKYLFFLELGTIGRSDLGGNSIITMAKSAPNQTVTSFTIDIKQKKLYFSATDNPGEDIYIASSEYDFSGIFVYPGSPGYPIYRMTVFQNTLYLIVYEKNIASTLYSTILTGSENQNFDKLLDAESPLTDIVVYHPKTQMSPDDQACEDLKCSHMCEIVEAGAGKEVACSCPRPLKLDKDGATCIDVRGDKDSQKWLQTNNLRRSPKPPLQPKFSDGNSWFVITLGITGVVCSCLTLWFYLWKNKGLTWGNHRWEHRNNWWRRPETRREDNHFTSKTSPRDK